MLLLKLCGPIIFKFIVRHFIKNNEFRTRHCTHVNTAFSTESGNKV